MVDDTGARRQRHASSGFGERHDEFVRRSEWPAALVALLTIPALLLEEQPVGGALHATGVALNWIVWIGLVAELAVRRRLASPTPGFWRAAWFDIALIVLTPPFAAGTAAQTLRTTRALRLLRLLRLAGVATLAARRARSAFGERQFHYVALVGILTVGLGAVAIYLLEAGSNPSVGSLGDALWWAVVTTTTVGYGDVSPQTPEGRLVAVLLMFVGIGVIGVFTGTVASFFVTTDAESHEVDVQERLRRIEEKLDAILGEARRPDRPADRL
jgi:voltage-gated potassium channel